METARREKEIEFVRAQLATLERQQLREDRAQAEQVRVDMAEMILPVGEPQQVVHGVAVINESQQFIRHVRGGIRNASNERFVYSTGYQLIERVDNRELKYVEE